MKNSRINRIFSAQAGPRIAHSIDQVWSVCDADYSVTYGWNRSPEFLICCSVSKRFCLLWKAFHHLNKIRYILWVEALLETCDATNSAVSKNISICLNRGRAESLDDTVSMMNNAEGLQVRLFTVRFFSLFLFQRAWLQTTTLRLRDWDVTRKDGLRTTKTLLYLGFRVQ